VVRRREAERPNEIWQADHTMLDILLVAKSVSQSMMRKRVLCFFGLRHANRLRPGLN
jgi:hypothetical protein